MNYSFKKSIQKGLEQYEKMKDDMFYFSTQLEKAKKALSVHGIEAEIEINNNVANLLIYQSKIVVINKNDRKFFSDFDKEITYDKRDEVVSYLRDIFLGGKFWMFIKKNEELNHV